MSEPVFHFFASTLSDIYAILPYAYAYHGKEIQIVLAFARDYDRQGTYKTGEFSPYFDTITPQDILDIMNGVPAPDSIKFFLSIGGRGRRSPFVVYCADEVKSWVRNATKSLTKIVQDYHFDGIDVYYEDIKQEALPFFSTSIAQVIGNLKSAAPTAIITQASITISDPFIETYLELCRNKPYAKLIDNVVYQCFTLTVTNPTPGSLVDVFHNKLFPYYPRENILAAYSEWLNDRTNVTPDTFARALAQLLRKGSLGISMWYGKPAP